MPTIDETRAAADAAYRAFLLVEHQLPMQYQIERSDARWFADRRHQGRVFSVQTKPTKETDT